MKTGRPTKLDDAMRLKIVTFIKGGAFSHISAVASGITEGTFKNWMRRGREAKSGPYREFFEDVEEARAFARVTAEVKVKQLDPWKWLRYGPGRSADPEAPGWGEEDPMIRIETEVGVAIATEFQPTPLDPAYVIGYVRTMVEIGLLDDGVGPNGAGPPEPAPTD